MLIQGISVAGDQIGTGLNMKLGITMHDVPSIDTRMIAVPMPVRARAAAAFQFGLLAYGVGLRLRHP